MQVQSKIDSRHVILESDIIEKVDQTLPLNEQVTQFQEQTAIQKKLIAEQAMQIYWLIAELRGRDDNLLAS